MSRPDRFEVLYGCQPQPEYFIWHVDIRKSALGTKNWTRNLRSEKG